jgi:hypothetical protein
MRARGDQGLPAVKVGRRTLYRQQDVDRYVEAHRESTDGE